MAAKGAEEKKKIFEKIMEVFPGSFYEEQDKKLRIPIRTTDNEEIQIRLQLTTCKDLLSANPAPPNDAPTSMEGYMNPPEDGSEWEMTPAERKQVANVLSKLGI